MGVEGGEAPWNVVNFYAFSFPPGGLLTVEYALRLEREFQVRLDYFRRAVASALAEAADWLK